MEIPNILWSKGPLRTSYSLKPTEMVWSQRGIIDIINSCKDILWIRLGSYSREHISDLDLLSRNLNELDHPIKLITSDGDRSVPSSYNLSTISAILDCPNISVWYTQNYDQTLQHAKLKNIPIGLDLHTPKWLVNNSFDDKIQFIINSRKNNLNKITTQIFCDAHLTISHIERRNMINILKNNTDIVFLKKPVSFEEITKKYNEFQFVLSPRGRGLDCHRTWELLLAGCIVITKTSSLDTMFINNNLPVVILQDWNELNNNLSEKLQKWYMQYFLLTSIDNIYPKLQFSYWIN
jgi:hypothetical protein